MPGPDFAKFTASLTAFVRKRVSHETDVQDLVQEILTTSHAKAATLTADEAALGWLYKIARNKIIDYYRSNDFRRKHELLADRLPDVEAVAIADSDGAGDAGHCLRAIMAGMKEEYRQALMLFEFDDMSTTEIASKLSLSIPGAKSRIQRARQQLRAGLEECCDLDFDTLGDFADAKHKPHDCRFCDLVVASKH